MSEISRVGDFTLQWGESLRWDDRKQRLYFVDCATQTLHWLENAQAPLYSLTMPSLPTGIVLTDGDAIVIALDDGLYAVDVEKEDIELLSPYPEGLGDRANDATADLEGNLITGTLSMAPTTQGSYWWYSSTAGWRKLDDGIGNANGPVVLEIGQEPTLVFADTPAPALYAYPYEGSTGTVGERRTFADTRELGGMPDGACADDRNGVWSCVLGSGKIARYTSEGLDLAIDAGVELPSDVTFGGKQLDTMFFVSIAIPIAGVEVTSSHAGALMAIGETDFRGRPEPRFRP